MNPNHSVTPGKIVEKDLSYAIGGTFYEVYNEVGYGYLESPYVRAMEIALKAKGLKVEREHEVLLYFRGHQIGLHRLDLLVEGRIVVEVKSTERIGEGAKRQLRTYLTATNLELGLLLHFGPKPEFYRILGHRPKQKEQ